MKSRRMTVLQRRALEAAAAGAPVCADQKTLKSLQQAGLMVGCNITDAGRARLAAKMGWPAGKPRGRRVGGQGDLFEGAPA